MSFCRFSCDNWTSDVYAYQAREGYVIHVASKRHVGEIPPLTDPLVDLAAYFASYKAQMAALEKTTLVPIGLAVDGESYVENTLADLLERLLELRALGYHVPEAALAEIREELTALAAEGKSE